MASKLLYFLLGICICLTTYAKYPVNDKVQKGVWGYCQKRFRSIFSVFAWRLYAFVVRVCVCVCFLTATCLSAIDLLCDATAHHTRVRVSRGGGTVLLQRKNVTSLELRIMTTARRIVVKTSAESLNPSFRIQTGVTQDFLAQTPQTRRKWRLHLAWFRLPIIFVIENWFLVTTN